MGTINALEVLSSRIAKGEHFIGRGPLHEFELRLAETKYPPYHSVEWWDMMWKNHEAWREGMYPAPAGTGWEVTPASGVEVAD